MTRRQGENGDALCVRLLSVSVDDDVGITNGTSLGSYFDPNPRRCLGGPDYGIAKTQDGPDQAAHSPLHRSDRREEAHVVEHDSIQVQPAQLAEPRRSSIAKQAGVDSSISSRIS